MNQSNFSSRLFFSLSSGLALFTLWAACGTAAADIPPPPDWPPRKVTSDPCESMGEAECIKANNCVLEGDRTDPYHCRKALDDCEVRFSQQGAGKSDCLAMPGCKFDPGSCYCPPPNVCVCGGGPPPRCYK